MKRFTDDIITIFADDKLGVFKGENENIIMYHLSRIEYKIERFKRKFKNN